MGSERLNPKWVYCGTHRTAVNFHIRHVNLVCSKHMQLQFTFSEKTLTAQVTQLVLYLQHDNYKR